MIQLFNYVAPGAAPPSASLNPSSGDVVFAPNGTIQSTYSVDRISMDGSETFIWSIASTIGDVSLSGSTLTESINVISTGDEEVNTFTLNCTVTYQAVQYLLSGNYEIRHFGNQLV